MAYCLLTASKIYCWGQRQLCEQLAQDYITRQWNVRESNLLLLSHQSITIIFKPPPPTTITVLWPFVRDYLGEPVPEETFTHTHLTPLNPSLALNPLLGTLVCYFNFTHPSDHSHLCPLKCHLIFRFLQARSHFHATYYFAHNCRTVSSHYYYYTCLMAFFQNNLSKPAPER